MPRRRKSQRPNATGRSDTSRFVRLDYRLLQSNAYRSLTPNARALLIELAMLYNGENNGSLYLGVQDAAHRMGLADHHAAGRAFDELQFRGFIEMTQDAHFGVKAAEISRARTWRLTCFPGPGRKMADWSFMDCEPEPQTPERRRMERGQRALKAYRKARDLNKLPVVDFTTLKKNPGGGFHRDDTPGASQPVVDSTTLNRANGGNPTNACMVDSHHHIATMGTVARSPSRDWPRAGGTRSKARRSSDHYDDANGTRSIPHIVNGPRRACEQCNQPFELTRLDRAYVRRFCSERCRKAAERARYYRRCRAGTNMSLMSTPRGEHHVDVANVRRPQNCYVGDTR